VFEEILFRIGLFNRKERKGLRKVRKVFYQSFALFAVIKSIKDCYIIIAVYENQTNRQNIYGALPEK
jgi:hypothetical protein